MFKKTKKDNVMYESPKSAVYSLHDELSCKARPDVRLIVPEKSGYVNNGKDNEYIEDDLGGANRPLWKRRYRGTGSTMGSCFGMVFVIAFVSLVCNV